MSYVDLAFHLYTDAALTSLASPNLSVVHNTSLSDNPQDFVRYFGNSAGAGIYQLQASSNPGVDQITLTPTDTLTNWAVATAKTLGVSVEPTVDNTYRYECTTAGTTHATTEPVWPTTIGLTIADGTVVWTCASKTHPTTEIKLATTSGGLAAATPGAALNLGHTILSGSANAVAVHIRVTNTVTTVGSNVTTPEIGLYINAVEESTV